MATRFSCCLWASSLLVACALRRGSEGKAKANSQFNPFRFNKNVVPTIDYPATLSDSQALTSPVTESMRWYGHRQVLRSLEPALSLGFTPSVNDGDADGLYAELRQQVLSQGNMADGLPDDENVTKAVRIWNEFFQVADWQVLREQGRRTREFMSVHPLFEADETLDVSAQRVRADFPPFWPTQLIDRWLASSEGFAFDENIFKRSECGGGGLEFVNGKVALGGLIGWAIITVSPVAFATKWHVGRLRPEEFNWQIQNGAFSTLEAPEEIAKMAAEARSKMRMLTDPTDFTAYPGEGSPNHPSYPAMHSAASVISTWSEIVGNLTDTQREEARLLDFSIAFFRSVAGVHYPSDNRAGLAIGQAVLEGNLAEHLAELYACSESSKANIKAYVEGKIRNMGNKRVDWANWRPAYYNPPWAGPWDGR